MTSLPQNSTKGSTWPSWKRIPLPQPWGAEQEVVVKWPATYAEIEEYH